MLNIFGKKNTKVDLSDSKKKKSDDDFDMSEFETDDFDMDGRSPGTSNYGAREVVEDAAEFSKILATKTAGKVLPEEYSYGYTQAVDFKDYTKEVLYTNKSKIQKELGRLNSEVKKLVPKKLEGVFDKIGGFLGVEEQQQRGPSVEEQRTSSINSNLDSIFNKQLQAQAVMQAESDAKEEVAAKTTLTQTRRTHDILIDIANSTANQSSFTMQIAKEYYKKSLELQYKSFYIQVDMLETTRNYYKAFSSQFDLISKNTALPEYTKLQAAERLGQLTKDRVITNILDRTMQKDGYIANLKQNFSKFVSEKTDNITNKISEATSGINMMNEASEQGGKSNLVISLLKGMGMDWAANKLSDKIEGKYKGAISNNKYVKTGRNMMANFYNSPQAFFGNIANRIKGKLQDSDATPEFIKDNAGEFLNIFKPKALDTTIRTDGILDATKPAIFDNNVYRSITDTIPLYLSKILLQNTNLTGMYKTINGSKLTKGGFKEQSDKDSLHYDFDNRSLDTITNIKTGIMDDLKKKAGLDKEAASIKGISNKIGLKGEKAELLQTYLKEAKLKVPDDDYNIDTLITKAVTEDGNIELKKMISKNPKLAQLLKDLNNTTGKNGTIGKNLIKHKQGIDRDINTIKDTSGIEAVITVMNVIMKMTNETSSILFNKEDGSHLIDAFKEYIINDNGVLTTDGVIRTDGTLAYLPKDPAEDKVQYKFKRFMLVVHDIRKNGDMHKRTILDGLLGELDSSIRNSTIIDPNVLKAIYNINSKFIDVTKREDGRVNIDIGMLTNITKGRDKNVDNTLDLNNAEPLTHTTPNAETPTINKITNKIATTVTKVKNVKDLFKAGKYTEAFTAVKSIYNEALAETEMVLKKLKDSTIENLAKGVDEANKLTIDRMQKAIDKLKEDRVAASVAYRAGQSTLSSFDSKVNLANLKRLNFEVKALETTQKEFIEAKEKISLLINTVSSKYEEHIKGKTGDELEAAIREWHKNNGVKQFRDAAILEVKTIYGVFMAKVKTTIDDLEAKLIALVPASTQPINPTV